jgi:hypothetical protein
VSSPRLAPLPPAMGVSSRRRSRNHTMLAKACLRSGVWSGRVDRAPKWPGGARAGGPSRGFRISSRRRRMRPWRLLQAL